MNEFTGDISWMTGMCIGTGMLARILVSGVVDLLAAGYQLVKEF